MPTSVFAVPGRLKGLGNQWMNTFSTLRKNPSLPCVRIYPIAKSYFLKVLYLDRALASKL